MKLLAMDSDPELSPQKISFGEKHIGPQINANKTQIKARCWFYCAPQAAQAHIGVYFALTCTDSTNVAGAWMRRSDHLRTFLLSFCF
jgi:hypothetical protein